MARYVCVGHVFPDNHPIIILLEIMISRAVVNASFFIQNDEPLSVSQFKSTM